MLEWLMRKLFPGWLRKPTKRELVLAKKEGEIANRDGSDNEKIVDRHVEPSLDMSSVQPLTPQFNSHKGLTAPSSLAQEAVGEQSEKIHIFNFRAWFFADPVKASLTLGLAFLSWLATYTGMLELIQANTGSLDIGSRVAIGFAVMMLMLMILYLLDSLYSGGTPKWIKPLFVFGYLFLTLISVGFGFGFYWKYLEAQTEATRSAESAVSQVQVALQIGQSRLEQLQSTFTQLTTLSTQKATQERDHGNSCPNSSPGEGPRMRLRDSDSQKFGYAADYITGRATTVNKDLTALNIDLKKVVSRDASTVGGDGTRNKFLRALGRKLDLTIARFNTLRTDPQLRQFRENFDKRASTTVFPNGRGGTFRCPDVQLQTALRGVVRAIDDIPEIKNPKIAAVEGSEAIIEAFRRLAVTLAALPTLKLPPSPDELRKARKQAISAGRKVEVSNLDAGLSKRDYIPLSAAVFVDLCILLISLNRSYDHLQRIQTSVSRARASKFGGTMLDIFEAHKNKISQEMLEIFHNAEFEYGRDYYLAVPLVKGSQKALLSDRLDRNIEEGYRSERDDYDRDIRTLEKELAGLLPDRLQNEEIQARKLTREHADLCGTHNQLLNDRKQFRVTYQKDTDDEFNKRAEVVEIVTSLEQTATYFKALQQREDRLKAPLARIVVIEKQIDALKKKRTANLKKEREEIKGQLSTGHIHDIAKESRFLSNLCISLEANGILHLASIWPLQRVVRSELKRHDSRYYAEGRNYRVYRFRKVADTQSQMVLDLIMEAVKRSQENGDLNDNAQTAPAQVDIDAAIEKARLEEQERFRQELKERDEQELRLAKDKIERLEKEKAVTMEAARQAESPINKDTAVDGEIITIKELSPEAITRANRGLRKHLEGTAGLGVSEEKLADLVARSDSANIGKPVIVEAVALPDEPSPKSDDKSTGVVSKMLGGIMGFGKKATPVIVTEAGAKAALNEGPGGQLEARLEAVQLNGDLDERASEDLDKDPIIATKDPEPAPSRETDEEPVAVIKNDLESVENTPDPETNEPFVAVKPITEPAESATSILSRLSSSEKTNPQERSANEDSLLPEPSAQPNEPQSVRKKDEPVDQLSNDPVSKRIAELQRGLKDKKFGRSNERTETSTDQSHSKPLTDPVILGPGDASQDLGSMLMTQMNAGMSSGSRNTREETSELDNVEFGPRPKMFGDVNTSKDQASPEIGAKGALDAILNIEKKKK